MAIQKPNIAETQKHNRMGKIHRLLASIQACQTADVPADKEKLIAVFCFDYGMSRRTVLEYIKILENTGKVYINGNEITTR